MAVIDVLMPMRDASRWVAAAWRSLARQTCRDWRLLAVDDGSVDGTAAGLAAAAGADRRLHLVEQGRKGVASALNRGLREVSAPFVVRMDADDLAHAERFEGLLGHLDACPALGVVGSRVRLFPGRLVTRTMRTYLDWQNALVGPEELRNERFVECTVTHGSAAFRTAALLEAGGWWEGEGPEDLELFLRLHRRGVCFGKVPRELYFWREHGARETRCSPRLSRAAFRRTKVRYLAAETSARDEVHLFGRGESLQAWVVSLTRAGVRVLPCSYLPGEPAPAWTGLALFCFGHPRARHRVRRALGGKREGTDYLFVA